MIANEHSLFQYASKSLLKLYVDSNLNALENTVPEGCFPVRVKCVSSVDRRVTALFMGMNVTIECDSTRGVFSGDLLSYNVSTRQFTKIQCDELMDN